MHPQEISLEVPSPGALRAPGEGSHNGWQQPQRWSARQQTEVVLRQLRGEVLDVLSRDLGIPATRLTACSEQPITRAMRLRPPVRRLAASSRARTRSRRGCEGL